MDYNDIYSKVLNVEPKTRMVTVCDNDGKMVFSKHREGVKNLLTPEESKQSLEMAVSAWKKRTQLESKIGKGKYVLAEYERIKRITMPLDNDHLLYITTETDADHNKILTSIMSGG
ncbi:MAG: DUF6659 family protein [Nitrososphaeraceae archaeon]